MRSSPPGAMAGPSYVSATLATQRFALALLTDSDACAPSSPPSGVEGNVLLQSEEILRVTSQDVHVFVEMEIGVATTMAATRGSAMVNVEVQDFGNFLRVPLLSHALLTWNVSGRGGGGNGQDLLSPFRPVVSAAVEAHGAVVSVSVTAMQCVDRCIGELTRQRSLADGSRTTRKKSAVETAGVVTASAPEHTPPPQRQTRQRSNRYLITNSTDRTLWFGQVSTTETLMLRAGEDKSYRWRKIPAPVEGGPGGGSRLALMLRLALHRDSGNGFGAWTEPFLADHAGTFMVRAGRQFSLLFRSLEIYPRLGLHNGVARFMCAAFFGVAGVCFVCR